MSRNNSKRRVLIAVNIVALFVLTGSTVYLYMQNKDLNEQASLSQEDKLKIENNNLLADVGKLMDLPEEEPTIFKVNDPQKAEEDNPGINEIFSDLQINDYLLIYKTDRLGIQYRPSQKKIIKTATLNLPIVIEIFGSEEAISEMEKQLLQLYDNRVIITKQSLSGVTQSFVYDNTNKLKTEVEALSKGIGYQVGSTLPESIKPTDQTEIVIVATSTTEDPVQANP